MKNERLVIVALLALVAVLLMRPADAEPGASGPVEPTLVAVSGQENAGRVKTWRAWSDGSVDFTSSIVGYVDCTVETECTYSLLPGSCTADITRNGNVDFEDILPILTEWGPCE